MKKMLVAASVLAVITGVVAAVCKNRKKYTKVRTNSLIRETQIY